MSLDYHTRIRIKRLRGEPVDLPGYVLCDEEDRDQVLVAIDFGWNNPRHWVDRKDIVDDSQGA